MIKKMRDIKIIANQKIREIIVPTEWEMSGVVRYNGESIYVRSEDLTQRADSAKTTFRQVLKPDGE